MKKLIVLVLMCVLFMGFIPAQSVAKDLPKNMVRVAMLKNVDNCVISIRGPYKIINPQNGKIWVEDRVLKKSRVLSRNGGIYIGKTFFPSPHVRIWAKKDVTFHKKSKTVRYRGFIDVKADKQEKLLVLNILTLEDYVKGVLYHEVDYKWPIEVIKAQAVATRSYVLYQKKQRQKEDYDVTGDIYSQVYGGRSAERHRTNLAAQRTRGQVLLYNKDVFPAYFHANSGGRTEDVRELWDYDELGPLHGVEDEYAVGAPHYRWKRNFRSADVQTALNENGYNLGMIKDINIIERNASDRIRWLEILTREGDKIKISGKKFREIIGPNKVKSNNYKVNMQGYYFDLIGKGWGHGVGMCQWGAYRMAMERKNYQEILNHYYPGTELIVLSP